MSIRFLRFLRRARYPCVRRNAIGSNDVYYFELNSCREAPSRIPFANLIRVRDSTRFLFQLDDATKIPLNVLLHGTNSQVQSAESYCAIASDDLELHFFFYLSPTEPLGL